MIRNLKALGLALSAVFAMGALTASSASAVDVFTTEGGGTVLATGLSTHGGDVSDKFEITGAGVNFTCTTSKFAAEVANGATSVTVDPEYTGRITQTPHGTECDSSAIGNVTVDMEGCGYILKGETTGHDPVGTADATISVDCPAGKVIKITGAATITVPAQTPTTGGVTYTNITENGKSAITLQSTATGITYECDGVIACGFAGIAAHGNDSNYTGHTIITCWEKVDGLPTPVTEGAQKGCSVS